MSKQRKSISFPNPINANNKLDNQHCFYVATSEGGKTSACKQLSLKRGEQVAIFDPYGDYGGTISGQVVRRYELWGDFYKALVASRKSGSGFIIVKSFDKGLVSSADFDRFCGIVWSLGNGDHPKRLHAVCEEVAQFAESSAKADGYYGYLMRVGRKFGLVVHSLFQRGQEVPKTVISNCARKWVGIQERPEDSAYLARATGFKESDIEALKKLEYLYKSGSGREYSKGKLTFKR